MALVPGGIVRLLRETVKEFGDDDCPRMAAALSYYTVFSLPPLLVLLLALAGAVLDPARVQREVVSRAGSVIGPEGVQAVTTILRNASLPGGGGAAAVLGIAGLLFGATGAFAELQASLNAAWEIAPDPTQGGIRNFVVKRVLSFGMILAIGFLLLVSLLLSAAISALGDYVGALLPGGWSQGLVRVLYSLGSFALVAGLFAAIYRVLPDAVIRWQDVAVGALATAALFTLGRLLLGLYLGRSAPGSAYGAAGSLALLLVWVYYSSMILLLGAEFTQVWARVHGRQIDPEPGAVRIVQERRPAPPRPAPHGPSVWRALRERIGGGHRPEDGSGRE